MTASRLSREFSFSGRNGQRLSGRLELPVGPPRAVALLAHCFTCSKDSPAAARIARALAESGLATLRFDFTGLGNSQGDFANTNFSSNVEDLVAAAEALATEGPGAPSILIGHSLGGAAVIAAAGKVGGVKAVVTLGAPADPEHVLTHIEGDREVLARDGVAPVVIGGRHFTIRQSFIDDIQAQPQSAAIEGLNAALLVMHAPADSIVPVENGERIFARARHPKSFVSLDGATHLLNKREDAAGAAAIITAWLDRIFPRTADTAVVATPAHVPDGAQWAHVQETGEAGAKYGNLVSIRKHLLPADEPRDVGGGDTGPSPHEFLIAALGACTSMTLRMYADRKGWTVTNIAVTVTREVVPSEGSGHPDSGLKQVDLLRRFIAIEGELDAEQRARLLEIANKCPVHRTLENRPVIRSQLV